MRVMLLGATGLVGAATLRLLVAADEVSTIVAPSRAALGDHDKVINLVTSDLLAIRDREEAWRDLDSVICAIGTTRKKAGSDWAFRETDFGIPVALAQRAAESGVPAFLYISSLGAASNSRFLYTRTKGEVEVALGRLGFPSLTIVRPSLITGPRVENRLLEDTASLAFRILRPVIPLGLRPNSAESIASVLRDHALRPRAGLTIISSKDLALARFA